MEKRWVMVFKALGNVNRIKIMRMLGRSRADLSVTKIAEALGISIKSTSRHLSILQNLELLESEGKGGFVYYRFHKNVPADFKQALKLFL